MFAPNWHQLQRMKIRQKDISMNLTKLEVDGDHRIGIYAYRKIAAGEEAHRMLFCGIYAYRKIASGEEGHRMLFCGIYAYRKIAPGDELHQTYV